MYETVITLFGKDGKERAGLKSRLHKELSQSKQGFHKSLLNYKILKVLTEKHVIDAETTLTPPTNAYRRKNRHKYYFYSTILPTPCISPSGLL